MGARRSLPLPRSSRRSPSGTTPSGAGDSASRSGMTASHGPRPGTAGDWRSAPGSREPPERRPPVLLVHGLSANRWTMDSGVEGFSLAAHLARAGFRTFSLDLRGHGDSRRPPRPVPESWNFDRLRGGGRPRRPRRHPTRDGRGSGALGRPQPGSGGRTRLLPAPPGAHRRDRGHRRRHELRRGRASWPGTWAGESSSTGGSTGRWPGWSRPSPGSPTRRRGSSRSTGATSTGTVLQRLLANGDRERAGPGLRPARRLGDEGRLPLGRPLPRLPRRSRRVPAAGALPGGAARPAGAPRRGAPELRAVGRHEGVRRVPARGRSLRRLRPHRPARREAGAAGGLPGGRRLARSRKATRRREARR